MVAFELTLLLFLACVTGNEIIIGSGLYCSGGLDDDDVSIHVAHV